MMYSLEFDPETTTPFDERAKREIAGRARTLLERVQSNHREKTVGSGTLIQTWEKLFSSPESFETRLQHLGVTTEEARIAVGTETYPDDQSLPAWITDLNWTLGAVQDRAPQTAGTPIADLKTPASDRRPFEKLARALAGVTLEAADVPSPGEEAALAGCVTLLYERFTERFGRLLTAEFRGNVPPEHRQETADDYYREYTQYLFDGGLAELCEEYPLFGRLLMQELHRWIRQTVSFQRRLQADRDRLAERFEVEQLGPVADAIPVADLDDDRLMMRVAFESGLTVVYKDRSVNPEEYFYDVLSRVSDLEGVPSFDTPRVLTRDGYGWMEWISSGDCPSTAAVQRYYRRVGVLTAVAYFLGLRDCSYDNLIAAGEHPVLIDAETILTPELSPDAELRETSVAKVEQTPLFTGILPIPGGGLQRGETVQDQSRALAGMGVRSESIELDGATRHSASMSRRTRCRSSSVPSRSSTVGTFRGSMVLDNHQTSTSISL